MTTWTKISHGEIRGANQRLWGALGNSAGDIASRINTDHNFVANIAKFLVNGGYEPSCSQKHAREIMGQNMFGVEENIRCFGVNPTKRQLRRLAEVPFSAETLRSCGDTHILVATFRLSLVGLRKIVKKNPKTKHTLSFDEGVYSKQTYGKGKGEVGWHLVRKTPVENSFSKKLLEQKDLLSENDEVPTTRVLAYTVIGHYLSTNELLFENALVRCSDVYKSRSGCIFNDSWHSHIGWYHADNGPHVRIMPDDDCFAYLGLASEIRR